MTIAEQLWDHVQGGDVAECWEWTRTRNEKGYGMVSVTVDGRWTTRRVHRLTYEQMIGQIPEGLQLDHLCLNEGCVNPWHLEPVPDAVNKARAAAERRRTGKRYKRVGDTCPQGHAWTPENTYEIENPNGISSRRCRACRRPRDVLRKRKARAA